MPTQAQTLITAINPPRADTKQAKLVAMLSRKSGVTLTKASESLGWLPHTTSAAMTGLRKRGYAVSVIEGGFVYKDKVWSSLSAIAKDITGAHWSGPRFFGLNTSTVSP